MSALPSSARPGPRRARPARRPALRVVGPPRHKTRYVVAMLVLGAAGVFGIVSLSALAAESAFAARSLERDIEALTYRYDELTAEVAALESPARVRDVATTELGMVPGDQVAYLVTDEPLDGPAPAGAAHDDDIVPASLVVTDPVKQALGSGN